MQINCLKSFVRYLIILIKKIANINNILELVVIISISRISNIKCFYDFDNDRKRVNYVSHFDIERDIVDRSLARTRSSIKVS